MEFCGAAMEDNAHGAGAGAMAVAAFREKVNTVGLILIFEAAGVLPSARQAGGT